MSIIFEFEYVIQNTNTHLQSLALEVGPQILERARNLHRELFGFEVRVDDVVEDLSRHFGPEQREVKEEAEARVQGRVRGNELQFERTKLLLLDVHYCHP